MTKEEAIEILRNNGEYDRYYIGAQKSKSQEAIDMAIDSLRNTCEDAISRQEAIDAINRLSTHKFAYEIKTGWIVRGDAVDKLRRLSSVNPQPETGRWIPVSERLPTGQTEVIASIHDDSGDTPFDYTASGWVTNDGEYWIVDGEINYYVTAWMPLPKPYEPQESEE